MKFKKVVLITAAVALLVPAAVSFADSNTSFSFTEAVHTAYTNDMSRQTKEVPDLSTGVQMYQSQLPLRGLQDAADIQKEYQDQMKDWNAELSAYRTMYDFAMAAESLEIAAHSLSQAENELEIVKTKRDTGVASDLDIMQAEVSVTNAKKSYENALMGYNIAERAAQQKLGLEMGKDNLGISLPSFSLLDEDEYDPEKVADEVSRTHESLRTVRYLIRSYNNILDDVHDLRSIPSGSSGTGELEDQLRSVLGKLGELKESPEADPTDILQLEALAASLQTQIAMVSAQAAQAPNPASVSRAERDLEEYYEAELHNAEVQLIQQIQALELLSYSYAERFKSMEKQIELQEKTVDDAFELYEANRKMLENGMIAPADLEQLRLNVENAQFQLLQLEKDYMILRKEFQLFLNGYMAGM